jgi:hypothetical protein
MNVPPPAMALTAAARNEARQTRRILDGIDWKLRAAGVSRKQGYSKNIASP